MPKGIGYGRRRVTFKKKTFRRKKKRNFTKRSRRSGTVVSRYTKLRKAGRRR